MLSTFALVALADLIFLAVGTEMSAADATVFEVMSELITELEQEPLVGNVFIAALVYAAASSLAHLFVFFRGCLPVVAAKVNQTLVCLSAGATRRATLAREAVINAAWGFINALRSSTVAGILFWVLSRLVLPPLLLVLRPFIPAILRKYFLWRNWVEARLWDFADIVCVDMGRRSERRRVLKARELQFGVQMSKLTKLNDDVARLARVAADVWRESRDWLNGEFEHLRPTEFAGRVVIAVPEEGPVPTLGLWFRLRYRVDLEVFLVNQTIGRFDSAMERNQVSITGLEHQVAMWSSQIRAIDDQVEICRQRKRAALIRANFARPTQIASVACGLPRLGRHSPLFPLSPLSPSLPSPPPRRAILPPPAPSPTPEEVLTAAAAATPLPKGRKAALLAQARECLEHTV
ncbi:hypothetical protein C8A01DRAFT_31276 [Parachaetomium inaequale]|uniref:Uncharacterized protein n=1 Tax=Parachaetomium inaequale TaxID=2588326 RepID=A0AAN6PNW6_9PEZI|nr:hypothetical protein C8A01DRAFT_31276 [Parachaetomium inaequale]